MFDTPSEGKFRKKAVQRNRFPALMDERGSG
jgi:hypothetical protein